MQGGPNTLRPGRGGNRTAERRDIRRMALLGAAVVAITAVATAGVAGTGGAGDANAAADPGAPFGTLTFIGPDGAVVSPTSTPTPRPTSAPILAPAVSPTPTPTSRPTPVPQLRITLAYERHDRSLMLTLTFAGYVFQPYSLQTGQLMPYDTPAHRDIGLSEHLDWGDGTFYDAPTKAQRCPQDGEKRYVHEVRDSYQLRKKFKRGGDYTISYRYAACGLTDGQIAGKLKLHVP
jgi:hypothetical protein